RADARLDPGEQVELAFRCLSAIDEVVPDDRGGSRGERAGGALRRIRGVLCDAVLGDFFGAGELEAIELRRDLEEGALVLGERVKLEGVADDFVLQAHAATAAFRV